MEHLASFLGYAERKLPLVHATVTLRVLLVLDNRQHRPPPGALTTALYFAYINGRTFWTKYVQINALKEWVVAELPNIDSPNIGEVIDVLRLLGCCTLFGLDLKGIRVGWLDEEQLSDIVTFAAPGPDVETIEPYDIQLWLGLHELARLRRDSVQVQAEVGERILSLLANADAASDLQRRLHAWIMDWLQRCAKSDWILVKDSEGPDPGG